MNDKVKVHLKEVFRAKLNRLFDELDVHTPALIDLDDMLYCLRVCQNSLESELEDAQEDLSKFRDKLSNSKMREVILNAISKRISSCDDDLCEAVKDNGADIVSSIEDKTVRDFVQAELLILNSDLNAPIATYKTVSNCRNASVVVYFNAEKRGAKRRVRKLKKYMKQISDYMKIALFLWRGGHR